MEQEIGSGSSIEHLNLQPDVTDSIKDEDPFDLDDMIDYAPSSSFSSSSSMGIDDEETNMTFSNLEENDSSSLRSSPRSPPDKPSVISASQQTDLNTLCASPKQSPAIQVMERSDGYDPNRIPSSVFAPRQTVNSEWSVGSNESLFSIQMENSSFLTDSGFFKSKTGDFNRFDDLLNYSFLTADDDKSPGLPTLIETASENEWKSASTTYEEKEELVESQSTSPIGSETENEKLPASMSSPNSTVPDLKGASSDSASTPRHSDASGQSVSSFAFPVLAGGASPMKVNTETPQPPPSPSPSPSPSPPPPVPKETTMAEPATTKDHLKPPKAGGNQWFKCFSCCLIRR